MARIRLTPEARREQLLELGTQLLATRQLEDLTIDLLADEARISRGLLYHYFKSKQEFQRAVIERAAAELIKATAPIESPDPLVRLMGSLVAYVDYVATNLTGYRSFIQAAHGGDPVIAGLYAEARGALVERMFSAAEGNAVEQLGFEDTPAIRLVVDGWMSMAETMVTSWAEDSRGLAREQMLAMLIAALPAMLSASTNGTNSQ